MVADAKYGIENQDRQPLRHGILVVGLSRQPCLRPRRKLHLKYTHTHMDVTLPVTRAEYDRACAISVK